MCAMCKSTCVLVLRAEHFRNEKDLGLVNKQDFDLDFSSCVGFFDGKSAGRSTGRPSKSLSASCTTFLSKKKLKKTTIDQSKIQEPSERKRFLQEHPNWREWQKDERDSLFSAQQSVWNKAGPWSGCPVSNPDPNNTIGLMGTGIRMGILRYSKWELIVYSTVGCRRTVCRRTARLEFHLKIRTTQAGKWVKNRSPHTKSVCCEDDLFGGIADFETTPLWRFETFQLHSPPRMRRHILFARYKLTYVTRRRIL